MARSVRHSTLLIAPIAIVVMVATGVAPRAQAPAPQKPAIERALIDAFIDGDDAARASWLRVHADIPVAVVRDALNRVAVTQRVAGELPSSARAFLALVFYGQQQHDTVSEVAGLLGAGSVEGTRSVFPKAFEYLFRALDRSVAAGYVSGQQQAKSSIGNIKRRVGDYDDSLRWLFESLELARQLNDPLSIARVYNNIGIVYNETGLGAKAIEMYSQSLALKEQNNATPLEITNTLSNIGGVYAGQGDYAAAVEYFRRALNTIDPTGQADAIASVTSNLGQLYSSMYDYPTSRRYMSQALALAEKLEDPGRTATALYIVAEMDRDEGKLDAAESAHRRALELRETAGDRLGLVESLSEMATLSAVRNRTSDALAFGERAVALASESRLINQLWKAQLRVGQIHASLGHDDEARQWFQQAIENIERLRQMAAGGEQSRQQYMAERIGPFYGLAALDVRAGRTFQALADIDRARARALVDILSNGRVPMSRATESERADEARLTQAVIGAAAAAEKEAQLPTPDAARIAALDVTLGQARLARDRFLASLYTRAPELQFARGDTREITRERLAALLPAGTVLVTFALDGATPWVYLATGGSGGPTVRAQRLPATVAALQVLSDRFARQIASRDLGFSSTARELYDALFASIDAQLTGARQIILIPDGPLWQVPFQALQTSRGRFLIEEHAVSYTPSIAALAALEERRGTRQTTAPFLVALGDPSVGTPAGPPGIGTQRSASLVRLPEAAREVRSLGELYGASHSDVLVDRQASESALRQLVGKASVVHIATHGVLDNINPMYSRILLAPDTIATAPGTSPDHARDGLVEAWELLDMNITANIAVLSACQTAKGGVGFGEGVIGLSWSLFAAGASTAVVSQWEVDSANTTNLMIGFHRALLTNTQRPISAPEALRQAAIRLIRQPASRHPFYWAGFISVGAR